MTETIQKTMRAAAMNRFGGIEEIKLQMLPVPEIEPDEVLIRIESAGVGVWDAFEREGGFAKMFDVEPKFPYVLGSDGAGTVSAVGEQANRFKEGDRVYAVALINPKGGQAQLVDRSKPVRGPHRPHFSARSDRRGPPRARRPLPW